MSDTNNKLTLWYDIEEYEEVRTKTRDNVKRNYGIAEHDLVSIGGGFKFLYDDTTDGKVSITFIPEHDLLRVTVEGTYASDVIDVFQNCLPDSRRGEEV